MKVKFPKIKLRYALGLLLILAVLALIAFLISNNYSKADTLLTDIEEKDGWTRTCYDMKGYNFSTSDPASAFAKLDSCPQEVEFRKSTTSRTADSGSSRTMKTGKFIEQDNKLTITEDSNNQLITPGTKYKLSFYLRIYNRECYDTQYYENKKYYDTTNPSSPTECTPDENNSSTCKLACAGPQKNPITGVYENAGLNPFNCTATNGFTDNGFSTNSTYPYAAYSPFCGDYDILIRDPNQYPAPGTTESYYKTVLPSRFLKSTLKYKNQNWFYNSYEFTTLANTTSIDLMVKQMGFKGYLYIDEMHLEKIESFVSDSDMVTPVNYPAVMEIDNAGTTSPPNPTFSTNAAKFYFGNTHLTFAHKENLSRHLATLGFPSGYLSNVVESNPSQGVKLYENDNVKIAAGADSTAIIKLKKDFNITLGGIPAAYHFYRNGLLYLRDIGTKKLPDDSTIPYGNGFLFTPVLSTGDLNQYSYQVIKNDGTIIDLQNNPTYQLRRYTTETESGTKYCDYVFDTATMTTVASCMPNNEIKEINRVVLNSLKKWNEPSSNQFKDGSWSITYSGKKGDAFLMSVFPPKDFDLEKFCNETSGYASGLTVPKFSTGWWEDTKQRIAALSNFTNVINLWDYYYGCSESSCPVFESGNYSYNIDLEKKSDGTLATLLDRFEASYGSDWKYDIQWPKELNQSAPWFQNIDTIRNKLNLKNLIYKSPQYHLNFGDNTLNFSDDTFVDMYNNHMGLKNSENNYLIDGTYFDGMRSVDVVKNLALFRILRNEISKESGRNGNGYLQLHSSGNTWFFDNRASETNGQYPDGGRFRLPFIDSYADIVWAGEALPFTNSEIWLNSYTNFGVSNSNTQLLMENKNDLDITDPSMTNIEQNLTQLNYFGQPRNITTWPNYYEGYVKNDVDENGKPYMFNLNPYYRTWERICEPLTKNNNKCDFQETYSLSNTSSGLNDCSPKPEQNPSVTYEADNLIHTISDKPVSNWIINNNPLFKLHYGFNENNGIFIDSSGNKLDGNIGGADSLNQRANSYFPSFSESEGRKYAEFDGYARLAGFHGSTLNTDPDRTTNEDITPILNNNNKPFSVFAQVKKTNKNDGRNHTIYAQDKAQYDPYNQAGKVAIGSYVQYLDPSVYLGIYDTSSVDKTIVQIKQSDGTKKTCIGSTNIDENWHMVGFTFEQNQIQIYVDGQKDGESCAVTNPLFDDTLFTIGALTRSSDANQKLSFTGGIDDLFIANTALSLEQVQTFYAGGDYSGYLKNILWPEFAKTHAVIESDFRKFESSTPTVSISSDKNIAQAGDTITYTLTYNNYSTEIITLDNLYNKIPDKTSFIFDSSTGLITKNDGTILNINRSYEPTTKTIHWIFDSSHPGKLNPGDKFVGTYQVTVN